MARVRIKEGVVQQLRLERAMSQADLADRAGVRQATVSNAERGKNIRYATLGALAGALGVEVTVLVEVIG
jgi:transcriptional regulator with XRE-family HTH domain